MTTEFWLPLRLKTQMNQSRDWRVRHGEVLKLRRTMALVWNAKVGKKYPIKAPFDLHLTRISPRACDDDNLASCFKAIRDEIAQQLGVNDGDVGRFRCTYGQEQGRFGVRIKLEAADA